jgi:hypothetical protein
MCRSVKVINNMTRLGSIYMEITYTKSQIIKETELKRTLRCDINIKIKQFLRLDDPLMVFQISIIQTLFITQLKTIHK